MAILLLSRKFIKLDMPNNGWCVPKPLKVWILVVLSVALIWVIRRPYSHSSNFSSNYIAVLSIYNLAIVAVWEEFTFRGLLWNQLNRFKFPTLAILFMQAIIFALCHYRKGNQFLSAITIVGYIWLFIWGILFGLIKLKSKSLVPGVISHALVNIVSLSIYPMAAKMFDNFNGSM